jgi:hypothetical protein
MTEATAQESIRSDAGRSVLNLLGENPAPLYCLLDCARDPRIGGICSETGDEAVNLYFGSQAPEMADVAPHLCHLTTEGAPLPKLLAEGWGRSWGYYLFSHHPPDTLVNHLRAWLLLDEEPAGSCFFRYYDPRILRHFLRACTAEEKRTFMGPIQQIVVEGIHFTQAIVYTRPENGPVEERARIL